MSTFTDKLSRQWQLSINVAAMRRAKAKDIDLSMPITQLRDFVMDDVFLCDALFAIVEPDAKAKGITLEQFEAGLDGNTLAQAREALWQSLYEYFDLGKAEMLRQAVASIQEEMSKATASLTGNSSGESRESLGTTSDPTE